MRKKNEKKKLYIIYKETTGARKRIEKLIERVVAEPDDGTRCLSLFFIFFFSFRSIISSQLGAPSRKTTHITNVRESWFLFAIFSIKAVDFNTFCSPHGIDEMVNGY